MKPWLRRAISGIIALIAFAMMLPNIIGPWSIVLTVCMILGPCAWVWVSAGRNQKLEIVGWAVQFGLLLLMFLG
jgi:hypothetical protein